jgi:tripartite-type tricarboxylate transporter receptor subunit TctC
VPFIIAVHPSFPAKTVPEFIAYARANPGKLDSVIGRGLFARQMAIGSGF